MSRRSRILTSLGGAVAALALVVPAGEAQAPTGTTLTYFEPDAGSHFRIIDNAPKSPAPNPQSSRYRFSTGDRIVFDNPLLDKAGGARQGTIYGEGVVVKGKRFTNIALLGTVTYVLNDGSQITATGYFSFSSDAHVGVTGGSGTYTGARGQVVSHNEDAGSTDTITLLP